MPKRDSAVENSKTSSDCNTLLNTKTCIKARIVDNFPLKLLTVEPTHESVAYLHWCSEVKWQCAVRSRFRLQQKMIILKPLCVTRINIRITGLLWSSQGRHTEKKIAEQSKTNQNRNRRFALSGRQQGRRFSMEVIPKPISPSVLNT